MPGSSVPDAIAGIVAVFTAANVPDLAVIDGPIFDAEGDTVAVGCASVVGQPQVAGTGVPINYPATQTFEDFTVSCVLSAWMGDEDLIDARARLFATYKTLSAQLTLDQTLGRTVAQARVGAYNLTQLPSTTTGYLLFDFSVDVKAFR